MTIRCRIRRPGKANPGEQSYILTHDEEQFQYDQEVSFSFTLNDYRSISPVINQEVDCAQEAEDIGGLETDQDAVEI